MSAVETKHRPAFRSIQDEQELSTQSISRLAVASFVLAVISLVAPVAPSMVAVCFVAIGTALVAAIRIARRQDLGGGRIAQAALALAVASCCWSLVATANRHDYLYAAAAKHAEELLNLLSNGKKYEAVELSLTEADRQITGTDLEQYYENTSDIEITEMMNGFLRNPPTEQILSRGTQAQWRFVRGVSIEGNSRSYVIVVEMEDAASDPKQAYHITLQRLANLTMARDAPPTAAWHVVDIEYAPNGKNSS